MKTSPINLLKISTTVFMIFGLLGTTQQSIAQALNQAKQKKETTQKEVKTAKTTTKTLQTEEIENASQNLQEAPAKPEAKVLEEQMRKEKLRKEADSKNLNPDTRKTDAQEKVQATKKAADKAAKTQSTSAEKAVKTDAEKASDEISRMKADLELRRQHGKLTEEEYRAALKKLEMSEKEQARPPQKPKLGTPDKK